MELIVNRKYSTSEMIKFFNTTPATWKKKKDVFLAHLQNYYEYKVSYDKMDMRKWEYTITKKLKDYEPPMKKGEKRNYIYEKKIEQVIEEDCVQTAMNVSRIIKNDSDIIALKHTDSTRYEYTRVKMRVMFGVKTGESGTKGYIKEKIWCKHDSEHNFYIELSPEEISNFYKLFKEQKETVKESDLTILSDFENGLISRSEMNEYIGNNALTCFINAKNIYKELYGFYPIKVPVYVLSGFEDSQQEVA